MMTDTTQPAGGAPAPGGRRGQRGRSVDGIVLLDKPSGITSNRALQQVKRLYNARKAGHTGSLDPLASGMLPICLGEATKVSAWLLDADKTYEVVAAIGQQTDSGDADGEVIATSDKQSVTLAELEAALAGLHGRIQQVPPMYSALKQGGRRLYELARAGQVVDRPPRTVTIHALEVIAFDPQRPRLRVRCSKGTYVRTLVEDLAASIGTLAHVAALRRIALGPFGGRPMVTLDELQQRAASDEAALDAVLEPLDAALQGVPAVHVNDVAAAAVLHGRAVAVTNAPSGGLVRLYGPGELLLAMGEALGDGRVAPKRVFGALSGAAKGRN